MCRNFNLALITIFTKKVREFVSMKKIIVKISEQKLIALAIVLFLAGAVVGTYTFVSIKKNLAQMSAAAKEPTTYFPEYPATNTAGKDPSLVKRGEYLAKAGDCIACHTNTPEKGTAFAGGLPMHTPFGTIYSPNITPDKATGIGNWTDEQFIKAMREGISPQGHYYYPAFPYYYFNKITTDDLIAIKAYLDSIPAISQKNRPVEMVKPFNQRFLQFGWRELFFRPQNTGPFQTNPNKSPVWNRGAYLVDGLGHCSMCHSPSYHIISESLPLGAPIRKYDLTGATVQGFFAPNISKANLATISDEEITRVFTEDHLIGGGNVEGPMLEVNHDSLKYLSQSDLSAIATYLKSVQSQTPPKPAVSGGPGAAVYESNCAGCHATGAGGAPKFGDASSWGAVLKQPAKDVYLKAMIGVGGMPAKGSCISCNEVEIKQAVDFMLAAAKGDTGEGVAKAPKPKPLTLADGKRIYDTNCSVCHKVGFKGAPIPGDKKTWQAAIAAGFLETYLNVETGSKGHIPQGACPDCNDAEVKAAVKYMMQKSDPTNDYELW
jgi:cytochrome c5